MLLRCLALSALVMSTAALADDTATRDLQQRVEALELRGHISEIEQSAALPPPKSAEEKAEQRAAYLRLCAMLKNSCD
ncbi:hypothetical protein AB6806_23945 [Bosea sp. RCC_152_1]|uniref:hypothetical protein n=1 Tax=Bosea sp. RCC_152_1 TaxID=3239228 RepID=UPI003525C8B2